jgi:hypothetical protein
VDQGDISGQDVGEIDCSSDHADRLEHASGESSINCDTHHRQAFERRKLLGGRSEARGTSGSQDHRCAPG